MRVIAGIYGGRILRGPSDKKTRPTSDRLRGTLFNILGPSLHSETRFLDLCAGTGAIGIEALSRGVSHVTFVDKSRKACGLVEQNLDSLRIPEDQTTVLCSPAASFLQRNPDLHWDVVFYDPPYSADYSKVIRIFGDEESRQLAESGVLIVEHHSKNRLPDAVGEIRRWRLLKQGETRLSFYERG